MHINKELMKGSTVILIMSLLDQKDLYGYEMTKTLEERSDGLFTLKEGTLYPILHNLEKKQWVESYWSEQEGRKRKYYRLTDEGRANYKAKTREWTRFRSAVDQVIWEGKRS